MIANMLAIRQGSIGHIRYVLKDSLKYLPFYGAYFRQVSCVHSIDTDFCYIIMQCISSECIIYIIACLLCFNLL